MATKATIAELMHPEYTALSALWDKYRLTYEGGYNFIQAYLEKMSTRETADDFTVRKKIAYVPAHAKAALIEVKNSIFNRMSEIIRVGGPASYQIAIQGQDGGVDYKNSTMNSFISSAVIPELLSMGKVGVYVDKQGLGDNITLKDTRNVRPYLYTYRAEDIRSWKYDNQNNLVSVLLRDADYVYDDLLDIPSGETTGFRYLVLEETEPGVTMVRVILYDKDGIQTQSVLLNLRKIPFVILELSQSLLTDIADHQIALLNLASSDLNYAFRSNFPFYTEQFDTKAELANLIKRGGAQLANEDEAGTAASRNKAGDAAIDVGTTHGRRYPIGTERPGYISPSAEPLRVSMEKQENIKEEICQLLGLSLTNLSIKRASKESKEVDERSKEAGLSVIAFALEASERAIVEIWALYDGSKEETTINYPQQYSLKTDTERRSEAKEKLDALPRIPSLTCQKTLAIQAAHLLVGNRVSNEDMKKIEEEIKAAVVLNADPEVITADLEAGLVGTETASRARLYPSGEVEKAKADHLERLKRIAVSQAEGVASARGIKDASSNLDGGDPEKKVSQNQDISPDGKQLVRGEGK